jgi:hypothetical protein
VLEYLSLYHPCNFFSLFDPSGNTRITFVPAEKATSVHPSGKEEHPNIHTTTKNLVLRTLSVQNREWLISIVFSFTSSHRTREITNLYVCSAYIYVIQHVGGEKKIEFSPFKFKFSLASGKKVNFFMSKKKKKIIVPFQMLRAYIIALFAVAACAVLADGQLVTRFVPQRVDHFHPQDHRQWNMVRIHIETVLEGNFLMVGFRGGRQMDFCLSSNPKIRYNSRFFHAIPIHG